jgi:hypothetical protein
VAKAATLARHEVGRLELWRALRELAKRAGVELAPIPPTGTGRRKMNGCAACSRSRAVFMTSTRVPAGQIARDTWWRAIGG